MLTSVMGKAPLCPGSFGPWRRGWRLFVGAGFLLLAFYGGLDGAGVGEGHAFEFVLAAGVVQYDEGAVDQTPDPDRRDVPDAHRLDVLSLPPAAQIHPAGVDAYDVVAVRRCLGYRWFQMLSVLFVPTPSSCYAEEPRRRIPRGLPL